MPTLGAGVRDRGAWAARSSAQNHAGRSARSAGKDGRKHMPAQTHLFLCLKDNYGVLLHDPASGATAAIDAPEAAPVEAALKATGWKLTDILVTHHHHDHAAAVALLELGDAAGVEAARIPLVDETVRENDKARVGGLEA